MRVVGGQFRGRRLRSVEGRLIRPTSDRVRESIFNLIGPAVVDARVIDLFAGTGAMAIEALSRGAVSAVCVDASRRALSALRRNVAALGLDGSVGIVRGDALDVCNRIVEDGATYDMVFCDPPYASAFGPIGETIVHASWWTTVCVVEHPATVEITGPAGVTRDVRSYGATGVTLFWRR